MYKKEKVIGNNLKKCKEKERVHFYRLTIIDVDVMNVTINKKNGDEKCEGEFARSCQES